MKNISHQPKALTIGIALVLGFAVLGAGCSQDQGNNDMAVPSTAGTMTPAPVPPQGTNGTQSNGTQGNGTQGNGMQNEGAAQNGSAAQNGDNGDMQAGYGDSQSPVSDTWITTKVTAKLHTIDGLDNTDIAVETNNGVVTLSGRVDSQDQLDTVVSAVKSIKGVTDVDTSRVETGADTGQ